jgi:hypothetical protein
MEFAKLVLRCLLVVATAGAMVGTASALVCPEAFTLGRPAAFGSLPLPLLGMLWGFLEFMMPGVVVGLAIGMAANVGDRPQIKAFFFRKPLWVHAAFIVVIAVSGGVIGWIAVTQGHWSVVGTLAAGVEPVRHPYLGAVWWASRAAQLANLVGGVVLAYWTWKKRREFEAVVLSGRADSAAE